MEYLKYKDNKYVRGYYYLKPKNDRKCLMDNLNSNLDQVLVCEELKCYGKKQEPTRVFTCYPDYIKLFYRLVYMNNHSIPTSVYELINFDYSPYVKPFFDIDIDYKETQELTVEQFTKHGDNVMRNIIKILIKMLNIKNSSDFMLFTSHRLKGDKMKYKMSFHLVLTKHKIKSKLMINLYKRLVSEMPELFSKYIDKSIYSNNSQYRVMFGCKYSEPKRTKQWMVDKKYIFDDEENEDHEEYIENTKLLKDGKFGKINTLTLEMFCRSLVTNTYYCEKDLSSKFESLPTERDTIKKKHQTLDCQITKEYALNILKHLPDKEAYEIQEITDNGLICLKRLKPSMCKTCKRVHEHENPYIYIDKTKNVHFNCRRNDKSYIFAKLC